MPPRKARGPLQAPTSDQVPQDIAAEKAVLGAVLVDGVTAYRRAAAILSPPDFVDAVLRVAFEAAGKLAASSVPIDAVTLAALVRDSFPDTAHSIPAILAGLIDGTPRSSNVEHYSRIVRDRSLRRSLMERALGFAHACTNGHETADILTASAALHRDSLAVDREARRRIVSNDDLYRDLATEAQRGNVRLHTFVPWLDRTIGGGIAPGEVCTFIARPQVGKSALASQVLLDNARASVPSVFFSLEMPRSQALGRLTMQALGLNRFHVEHHASEGWSSLTHAQQAALVPIKERIVIVDRGRSGFDDLELGIEEAETILQMRPKMAVVDYLGLLSVGARNLPLYQRVSEAAIEVKAFAKRHDLAVLLLCQAGRDVDPQKTEGAARLGLDAARDSGQVEEAADYLVSLWRPALSSRMDAREQDSRWGELHIGLVKSRNGRLGECVATMNPDTLAITSEEP